MMQTLGMSLNELPAAIAADQSGGEDPPAETGLLIDGEPLSWNNEPLTFEEAA